jgi:myo-inositol-1(or 4)-monophosphatase
LGAEGEADVPDSRTLVEHFLPVLVTAGDFAHQIQQQAGDGVRQPPQKTATSAGTAPNEWAAALTDADLGVQTLLEVATLAAYPTLGFYGEEQESSRLASYFPADAPAKLWLDPVNGTFLYRNQRPGWDIILSLTVQHRLVAAISYMPVRGQFYLAVEGRGALTGSRECRRLADMTPLRTQPGSRVCLTYQAPEVTQRVQPDFQAFDLVTDYDPRRGYDNLNDFFTGRLDAFCARSGDLLDWGAMAYVIQQAGGVVSALDGTPLDIFRNFGLRQTDMLVSSCPAVHTALLRKIN